MQSVFLVVEADDFVSDDLVQILRSADPDTQVVAVKSLAGAEDVIAQDTPVDTAFVHARAEDLLASPLLSKLEEKKASVVILNGHDLDNDPEVEDWVVVAVPFSSAMIESALQTARGRKK